MPWLLTNTERRVANDRPLAQAKKILKRLRELDKGSNTEALLAIEQGLIELEAEIRATA